MKSEHFHARGPSSRALARRELSTSVSQHPNSRPTDTLKNEIAGLNRITEKITSLVHKTYTFEEFNDIAAASGWMGEFGAYEF